MAINDKPHRLRVCAPRGLASGGVDKDARTIRNYSVATRGEALGHNMWLDMQFLNQIVKAGNSKPLGVKTRFTHPGLSGDGLGRALGRTRNFRRSGDQVFGDLHLLDSASKTPEGDLAGYVMDLAEESPDLFGASIVFSHDEEASQAHSKKHRGEDGNFKSPDEENTKNYPHARLAELHGSDLVDDPAANPSGFFGQFAVGSELAAKAESILAWALGLTDQQPDEFAIGPHPERIKTFVMEFLERHGLVIMPEKMCADPGDPQSAYIPIDSENTTSEGKSSITILENRIEGIEGALARFTRQLNSLEAKIIICGR